VECTPSSDTTTVIDNPASGAAAGVYVMGQGAAPLDVIGNCNLTIGDRLNADGTVQDVGQVDGLIQAWTTDLGPMVMPIIPSFRRSCSIIPGPGRGRWSLTLPRTSLAGIGVPAT